MPIIRDILYRPEIPAQILTTKAENTSHLSVIKSGKQGTNQSGHHPGTDKIITNNFYRRVHSKSFMHYVMENKTL